MNLGRVGLFTNALGLMSSDDARDAVREIEALGFADYEFGTVTDAVVVQRNRLRPLWQELMVAVPAVAIFVVGLITTARWLIELVRGWF